MPSAIDQAVALVRERLLADPTVGETLIEGFIIIPAPMTPSIRAAMFLPAAMAARSEKSAARERKIQQVIEDQRAINPAITDAELADALNQAGCLTYTKLTFTVSRLRRHLKKKNL